MISNAIWFIKLGMGSLQNLGNRGSNAAQQLAAQLSRSGGTSNPGVHAHQQGMLGGSGVGSGSSWGTGKVTRKWLNCHQVQKTFS